ncbi:MAG: serine protease [Marmoricola sp.]|nr:serine protease [Marmoricola sp.]
MDQQHDQTRPLPQQTPYGVPTAQAPWTAPAATARPSGTRRLLAMTAVTALVTGAAGVGVGYAGVHAWQEHHPATASAPATPGYSQGSTSWQLPPGYAYGDQAPTTPDTQQDQGSTGGTGTGTSTDTTSTASGKQLTGLVRIVSTMKYDGGKAAGTGMVLTSDGEVVTNHHVVQGATSVKVEVMTTGTTYTASVVGTDAAKDVAVLKLQDASGLATVTPDTDGIATGSAVTAVGDGNGTVDHLSAATGTVTAANQAITTSAEGSASGERLTGLMEISSDVVPGYSGGATYDADGQVVGMTTAASSGSSDVVGYAVPIATVLRVADDLESGVQSTAYSYGRPAFLGIGLGSGTTVAGAYAGTPAARAGLGQGDTITAIAGKAVTTQAELRATVAAHRPGERIAVSWTDASGARHTETLTLAQGPVA